MSIFISSMIGGLIGTYGYDFFKKRQPNHCFNITATIIIAAIMAAIR